MTIRIPATASGTVATFTGPAAPLLGVVSSFGPTQSGEGTPSLTNVRPIQGREEMTIAVNGVDTVAAFLVLYGCSAIDPIGGTATVDTAKVTFTGGEDEAWAAVAGANGYYIDVPGMKLVNQYSLDKCLCNRLPKGSVNTRLCIRVGSTSNPRVVVPQANTIEGVSNLATWRAWLADHPLELTYLLADPYTVAIPTVTAYTAAGENTVAADTGPVTVTYWSEKDTIPADVLAAIKADSSHKNLRVHFPGGEMDDLTNENIEEESMRFTESVCSQDTLKFGLAEASVLEFETVGVPSMRGATIEAVLEYPGIAAIPLGTFRVASCPRNAGALAHRKVTAYTMSLERASMPGGFEQDKSALLLPTADPYTPGLLKQALTLMRVSPADMESMGYTATAVSLDPASGILPSYEWDRTYKAADGTDVPVHMSSTYRTAITLIKPPADNRDELYSIDYDAAYDAVQRELRLSLAAMGVDPTESGFPDWPSLVKDAMYAYCRPAVMYLDASGSAAPAAIHSGEVFYPYRNTSGSSGHIFIPVSISAWDTRGSWTQYIILPTMTPPTIYRWSTPAGLAALDAMRGNFKATQTVTSGGVTSYSFIDAFPGGSELAAAAFELQGRFVRPARNGGLEMVALTNADPAIIRPGEYKSCWWDEEEPVAIGTVLISYKDGEEEQIGEVSIGGGSGVYDMTQNAYLKAMTDGSYDAIAAIIKDVFAPAVNGLAVMQIELDMWAQPQLQAGQALTVIAADGTEVRSFMLRREMDGIQALFDAVTAVGSEATE